MILLKSPREIRQMREVNLIVAEILESVKRKVSPGVTTWDLEMVARDEVKRRGVKMAFKGVKGAQGNPFPCGLCTSINDEVVHGIPSKKRRLESGDLLSVDFGVYHNGFYGDSAFSVPVGESTPRIDKLISAAWKSLEDAIDAARVGNRIGDISNAVQCTVERAGFSVVREFVGHGIGRSLHEEPQVPNYGHPGRGPRLKAGMVVAIEPMINDGGLGVVIDPDGWTARTVDGSLAAHVEHSIAVTDGDPIVLSSLA